MLLMVVSTAFTACSLFDNENDDALISAVIEEGELVIRNGFHFDVYYFAVDQSSLAHISWIPRVTEFNRIKSNEVVVVRADSLFAYKKGKAVVFFYWDEEISEILSIVIE